MKNETRIIELEQELIELRRAAVAVVLRAARACTADATIDIAADLDAQAAIAPPVEARLLRLVAEALRRG